jgi:hypothetical protein
MTMSAAGLAVDLAPPQSVPLRFFLTAPAFGIIASIILFHAGPDGFTSRWTLPVLAATHALTLGVITMVMAGAMLQLLPVLIGVRVPGTRMIATLVHLLLVPGVIALIAAMLQPPGILMPVAATLLIVAFTVFIGGTGTALLRSVVRTATAQSMRLALVALTVTVCLGLSLLYGRYASGVGVSLQSLHPLWGIGGWVSLMIIGVAYQVVPMFQFTADYPDWQQRYMAPAMISLLLLSGAAVLSGRPAVAWAPVALLLAAMCAFGGVTLARQAKRRRRVPDVTLRYWRYGMLCGMAAGGGILMSWLLPDDMQRPGFALVTGVLLLHGCVISLITGMLYKIVPFLLWMDLHSRLSGSPAHRMLPSMKSFISEAAGRRQSYLHWTALLLWVVAAFVPGVVKAASLALCASYGMLWLNLMLAWLRSRRLALPRPATAGDG